MKPFLLLSSIALYMGVGVLPAHADGPPVSIQFSIGTPPPPPVYVAPQPAYVVPAYPPPIAVSAPPMMIWLPEFGGYVALGISQPLFYLSGVYYYNSGGRWYSGPNYGGPWRPAYSVPPGLRKFHDRDWNRAQERARGYERNPQWQRFRAEPGPRPGYRPNPGRGPDRNDREHDRGRGNGRDQGHGNDRGNGH